MLSNLEFKDILFNDIQPSNALLPIYPTLAGMSMVDKLTHHSNAKSSIVSMPKGNCIPVNESQKLKADFPMDRIDSDICVLQHPKIKVLLFDSTTALQQSLES